MNFRFNWLKVVIGLILASVVHYYFVGSACIGGSWCGVSFGSFFEAFTYPFVAGSFLLIFVIVYTIWSFVQKKNIE